MVLMTQDVARELVQTATAIASPGKGILAADESTGTIKKRFDSVNVENTEANRSFYRGMLFTTEGLGEYISGAILFEETLFQNAPCGTPMVDLMKKAGIIPGIKVDKGIVELWGVEGEGATTGLDGLAARCAKYYQQGARFAKWRAVLKIDQATGKPSDLSIQETAHSLARYASICQSERIVPIVEPEILQDGSHGIEVAAAVTEKVLAAVFKALHDHHVLLEGCLLKPNMVTPGSDCPNWNSDEIASLTVRTLQRTVPPALCGVTFLSGGQSEEDASLNLNGMNALRTIESMGKRMPWALTFSYGRALQASVLKAWAGNPENKKAAQGVLMQRAKANSEAERGIYKGSVNGEGKESLFVKGYVY
uniref:Fructose-bisphosphate aldolase n=1 Tax=Corethron hystrix TaxID=216773 RepID=A0A7S1FSL4_9STRA|mmetsp:Transcript_25380/g.58581  ORF Transcript_25380/g.58581 Transcript_25380/m.58581 type:complete len:365 (+) Transcript_25380:53-1147(+)